MQRDFRHGMSTKTLNHDPKNQLTMASPLENEHQGSCMQFICVNEKKALWRAALYE